MQSLHIGSLNHSHLTQTMMELDRTAAAAATAASSPITITNASTEQPNHGMTTGADMNPSGSAALHSASLASISTSWRGHGVSRHQYTGDETRWQKQIMEVKIDVNGIATLTGHGVSCVSREMEGASQSLLEMYVESVEDRAIRRHRQQQFQAKSFNGQGFRLDNGNNDHGACHNVADSQMVDVKGNNGATVTNGTLRTKDCHNASTRGMELHVDAASRPAVPAPSLSSTPSLSMPPAEPHSSSSDSSTTPAASSHSTPPRPSSRPLTAAARSSPEDPDNDPDVDRSSVRYQLRHPPGFDDKDVCVPYLLLGRVNLYTGRAVVTKLHTRFVYNAIRYEGQMFGVVLDENGQETRVKAEELLKLLTPGNGNGNDASPVHAFRMELTSDWADALIAMIPTQTKKSSSSSSSHRQSHECVQTNEGTAAQQPADAVNKSNVTMSDGNKRGENTITNSEMVA